MKFKVHNMYIQFNSEPNAIRGPPKPLYQMSYEDHRDLYIYLYLIKCFHALFNKIILGILSFLYIFFNFHLFGSYLISLWLPIFIVFIGLNLRVPYFVLCLATPAITVILLVLFLVFWF